jgi:hypothetical protein
MAHVASSLQFDPGRGAWQQEADLSDPKAHRLAIHACFRLIAKFRLGVQQSASQTTLAATANAALELARLAFVLTDCQPSCSDRFQSDCNSCVAEIEDLVVALSEGRLAVPAELEHAMDNLIIQLVKADAESQQVGIGAS